MLMYRKRRNKKSVMLSEQRLDCCFWRKLLSSHFFPHDALPFLTRPALSQKIMLAIFPAITSRVLHPVTVVSGAGVSLYHKTAHLPFLPPGDPHPLHQLLYLKSKNDLSEVIRVFLPILQTFLINDEFKALQFAISDHNERIHEEIRKILVRVLASLPPATRNQIYEIVYVLQRPLTSDSNWGENHAFNDLERLVTAADCVGVLGRSNAFQCPIWIDWEQDLATKSHIYYIEGNRSGPSGWAGFINGLGLSFSGT